MASVCEPITELVRFNSRSGISEIVQLQSALDEDCNNVSETPNTDDILKPIIGRLLFPIIEHGCSLWSSFIDLFNFAKNRRNTSQGCGAFFFQSVIDVSREYRSCLFVF